MAAQVDSNKPVVESSPKKRNRMLDLKSDPQRTKSLNARPFRATWRRGKSRGLTSRRPNNCLGGSLEMLTSNDDDFDSELVVRILRKNKIEHKYYNPSLVNQEWGKHFQEVINKKNQERFSIKKEFHSKFSAVKSTANDASKASYKIPRKSRAISQITHPKDIKTKEDIESYKQVLKNSKLIESFNQQLDSQNNHILEQRTPDEIQKTKDYMHSHYKRSMSKKSAIRVISQPDFLSRFEFKKEPVLGNKYAAVKSGKYDLEKEEVKLCQILKDLKSKQKNVHNKFNNFGLARYNTAQQVEPQTPLPIQIPSKESSSPFNTTMDTIFEFNKGDNCSNLIGRAATSTPFRRGVNPISQIQRAQTQSSGPMFQIGKRINVNRTAGLSNRVHRLEKLSRNSVNKRNFSVQSPKTLSSARSPKTPLDYKQIKDIWDRSQAQEKYQDLNDQVINQNLKTLRQEGQMMHHTLDYFHKMQDEVETCNTSSLPDYFEQRRFQEKQDLCNFLDKEVINKVKAESFKSSIFISKLQGYTGGKSRQQKIWRPDKFNFTKKGPRFEEGSSQ